MNDVLTAAQSIADDHLAQLWEGVLAECLDRLALTPDQSQQAICFRAQLAGWTEAKLGQFLRETEAAIWTAKPDDFAMSGKLWVARFLMAQVELGRRLGAWPPELEPGETLALPT